MCGMFASAPSAPFGSGCSIISTPRALSCLANGSTISSVHASLASTIKRAFGAPYRTAFTHSTSPSPLIFNFNNGLAEFRRAAVAILSGVSALIVKAVIRVALLLIPNNSITLLPARFASRSQSAQSIAFLAAHGGRRVCSFCLSI